MITARTESEVGKDRAGSASSLAEPTLNVLASVAAAKSTDGWFPQGLWSIGLTTWA